MPQMSPWLTERETHKQTRQLLIGYTITSANWGVGCRQTNKTTQNGRKEPMVVKRVTLSASACLCVNQGGTNYSRCKLETCSPVCTHVYCLHHTFTHPLMNTLIKNQKLQVGLT